MNQDRIRIAIQKKGRLNNDSLTLLRCCGIKFRVQANDLYCFSENLPIDLLFVRDDDIPTLIADDICEFGIVGDNVLQEFELNNPTAKLTRLKALDFGQCRLSIAVPNNWSNNKLNSLNNKRIATSYPALLQQFLNKNNIEANIIRLSGSVEIAPQLDIADAICDLVSTGKTLEENNLRELVVVMQSQAQLIKNNKNLNQTQQDICDLLLRRINGVQKANESKYIMFHAPTNSLTEICNLLPGAETPTILPLEGYQDKMAVHAVASEGVFWVTLEKLKQAGASSILVMPIEKMLD
jgi:ATP phosphoribosyltransferase